MRNKFVILILISLMLCFVPLLRAESFHVLFLGGLNLAMQRDNLPDSDYFPYSKAPRVGYVFGGGLTYDFLPIPFEVEIDVMYDRKGTYYLHDDFSI